MYESVFLWWLYNKCKISLIEDIIFLTVNCHYTIKIFAFCKLSYISVLHLTVYYCNCTHQTFFFKGRAKPLYTTATENKCSSYLHSSFPYFDIQKSVMKSIFKESSLFQNTWNFTHMCLCHAALSMDIILPLLCNVKKQVSCNVLYGKQIRSFQIRFQKYSSQELNATVFIL